LSCGALYANSINNLEDILSSSQKQSIDLSYKKNLFESQKLKKDWINPITYKLSYDKSEEYSTIKSSIIVNQPIFKSGGIWHSLKYANFKSKLDTINTTIAKQELIKKAYNILFNIQKVDINIQRQKLLIQNSKLDIDRKKEQVIGGVLDTSFLDNAIIDKNTQENKLLDLLYQKNELINSFKNISDKDYKTIILPTFQIISKENFIGNNLYLKQQQNSIKTKLYLSKMTTTKYLPNINFVANYTKYHDDGGNKVYQKDDTIVNVGLNLAVNLSINYNNDIQSKKIEYLKTISDFNNQENSEKNLLDTKLQKIKMLKKKILISQDTLKLYSSLVKQMKELQEAGLKTSSDLQTLQNSKTIKSLDIDLYQIDIQLELLEIYARIYKA
jgi:outer membrane protein TolC